MKKKKKSLSEAWLSAGVGDCLRPPGGDQAEVNLDAETVARSLSKDIKILPEDQEPEYDSPHGSVWIVAVDYAGRVTVLETPNIHHGLLESGPEAEYLGLPPEVDDMDPGVYRWTCSFHEHTDWESGHVDGWDFEIEESILLWSPDNA